jgi:small redox-active disulfide protein 2
MTIYIMKIQVLGSGCPTCKKLHEIVLKAVSEMKLDSSVEYVTGQEGMQRMIELGAMESPVLTVDDKIVMTGFTPNIEIIKNSISSVSNNR